MEEDFINVNSGVIAEQYVGQELLAYRDHYVEPSLYYWEREARNSNAELDYLIPFFSYAMPVVVKAGKTGTLRSMHLFLEKYPAPVGIRISSQAYNSAPPIISIPFYGIQSIPRLVKEFL